MPDSDKSQTYDCSSTANIYSKVRTLSLERIPNRSESQSIIINFYSNTYAQKSDKVIQTDREVSTPDNHKHLPKIQEIKRKEASTSTLFEREVEDSDGECAFISSKKSFSSISHERRAKKSMESRKLHSDKNAKGGLNAKPAIDLERKKLEAELKAAEEIAKIKETVIEKRLALELASLQDTPDHPQKQPHPKSTPPPPTDLRALEEVAIRKQSLVETNLAQEIESLDFPRAPPPRPPPPVTPPVYATSPSRQPSPPPAKINTYRSESTSSMLNNFRNLNIIDRKFNLDKRFSGHSELRKSSPTNVSPLNEQRRTPETRYRTDRREERQLSYPRQEEVYVRPETPRGRARSVWKSAMSKIKKKMKSSKSPEDYRQ